jgi:hypothetical protein
MRSRPRVSAIRRFFFAALRFRVRVQPGGKMAPSRPNLTSVRRAVGVAAVSLLLSGAVVYGVAPNFPTSGSSPNTTADSSASPAPTRVGTQSATPGGGSSSAGPSRAGPSRASDPGPSTSTTTPRASDNTGSGPAGQETIEVENPAGSAKPFQTVRIQGTYAGGADTFLRVQRWERHRWLAFPLATKTDQSGRFTAYVELGQPGLYWLRVLDPDSDVKSEPFLLVIKG